MSIVTISVSTAFAIAVVIFLHRLRLLTRHTPIEAVAQLRPLLRNLNLHIFEVLEFVHAQLVPLSLTYLYFRLRFLNLSLEAFGSSLWLRYYWV